MNSEFGPSAALDRLHRTARSLAAEAVDVDLEPVDAGMAPGAPLLVPGMQGNRGRVPRSAPGAAIAAGSGAAARPVGSNLRCAGRGRRPSLRRKAEPTIECRPGRRPLYGTAIGGRLRRPCRGRLTGRAEPDRQRRPRFDARRARGPGHALVNSSSPGPTGTARGRERHELLDRVRPGRLPDQGQLVRLCAGERKPARSRRLRPDPRFDHE